MQFITSKVILNKNAYIKLPKKSKGGLEKSQKFIQLRQLKKILKSEIEIWGGGVKKSHQEA